MSDRRDEWAEAKHRCKTEEEAGYFAGIYKKRLFLQEAESFLQTVEKRTDYCMAAIDIEHFKLFNEWFGFAAGDDFLCRIAQILKETIQEKGGVAGYMSGDDFALLIPNCAACLQDVYDKIVAYMKAVDENVGFFPAIGVYVLTEEAMTVSSMYDRAALAFAQAKGNYVERIVYYKQSMQQAMEDEVRLVKDVQKALENGEMTYYLQPKCEIATGRIVGAEALVRWEKPGKGFLSPGFFIPYLEQNGLIGQLDYYVWNKVCQDMKEYCGGIEEMLTISVNLSRVDIYTMDVVHVLQELVDRYGLEPRYLEVEITESACSQDFEKMKNIIGRLRQSGFKVSMDDFGSGYSSLNMLKDINVDVLKIDMNFLNMQEDNYQRGIGIMESIVNMARLLDIPLVAEGVETRRHEEILKDIGCRYAQGYLYYKPMPVADFCELLKDENKVNRQGITPKPTNYVNIAELVENHVLSQSMVDKVLGAFAFYEMQSGPEGEQVFWVKGNRSYYDMINSHGIYIDLGEEHSMLESVCEEDWDLVLEMFHAAKRNPLKSAGQEFRLKKPDGQSVWISVSLYYLKKQDDRTMFCGQVRDLTEQRKRQEELEMSQKALYEVLRLNENDEDFKNLAEENKQRAMSLFSKLLPVGMLGGYCEKDFPLFFVSSAIVRLLGYDSYDDFASSIDRKVSNTIHEEDRPQVLKDVGENYQEGQEYSTTYRMVRKDGGWFWVLDKGRVIKTEDGRLAIISFCMDITEVMARQEDLKRQIELLDKKNATLEYLTEQLPGGYHQCRDAPNHPFLKVSDRFLELVGYNRKEIAEVFHNNFSEMVHPDDRKAMDEEVELLRQGKAKVISMEYRIRTKTKGYIWMVDQTCRMEYGGKHFFHGTVIDITKWK